MNNQTEDKLKEIISDVFAGGRIIGQRAVSADEWDRNVTQALAAINKEIERIGLEVIGEDEAPKPNPKSKDIYERIGTCSYCFEDSYCIHEIGDDLRKEQRTRLTQALKGREGRQSDGR